VHSDRRSGTPLRSAGAPGAAVFTKRRLTLGDEAEVVIKRIETELRL